jgi:riboflavin kinase / FMN adenylyltransferase
MRRTFGLVNSGSGIRTWVTVGIFDGVHLGHRRLIDALTGGARDEGARSLAVTFDPHPQWVLRKNEAPMPLLTPLGEKFDLLSRTALDETAVLAFDEAFASLGPEEFVSRLLMPRLRLSGWVIGYDHAFGRGGEGGRADLEALGKRFGFKVLTVPPVLVDGEAVSSTRIRTRIAAGDVAGASGMLGRPYALAGEVVPGQRLGREMGFPTANLAVPADGKCLPADGVYAVFAESGGKRFDAVTSIGRRPTVGGRDRTIETHLLDFDGNLYGEPLRLLFMNRLRDERKFDTVRAMIGQMTRDRDLAREQLTQARRNPCP